MKCNETLSKWCKNKHGASKITDTFETYQEAIANVPPGEDKFPGRHHGGAVGVERW
jgi:hypothetical protein